jgi:hypothetical protein
MKSQNANTRMAAGVLFALSVVSSIAVSTMNRTLQVNSEPPRAAVFLDNEFAGFTPFETNKIRSDIPLTVAVQLNGYAPEQVTFTQKEVTAYTRQRKVPWVLPTFSLVRLHLEVPIKVNANVEGASVFTNEHLAGPAPWTGKLLFDRLKTDPWGTYAIGVVKPNYRSVAFTVTGAQAEAKESTGVDINAALDEIQREIEVRIDADTPNANVFVNAAPAGTTPMQTKLTFTRADATQLWSTVALKISKEGYEFRPLGQETTPEFVKTVTVDAAAAGVISAQGFVPVKFVPVLLRTFGIADDKLQIQYNTVMAEVSQSEPQGQAPTPFTSAKPEDALVVSRIGVWPDHPDKVVYSRLIRDPRSQAGAHEVVIGAHICVNEAGLETPMGTGRHIDVDPFVTADGKYIYFSSDRGGKRVIWRMETDGTLPQPITGNATALDTEPVVSADGAKLAFTSRPLNALPSLPSTVWIADADGSLAAPTQSGHSPAWSPDGKKIAYRATISFLRRIGP